MHLEIAVDATYFCCGVRRALVAGLGKDFTGLFVDDVDSDETPLEIFRTNEDFLRSLFEELPCGTGCQLAAGFGNDLAVRCIDQVLDELD